MAPASTTRIPAICALVATLAGLASLVVILAAHPVPSARNVLVYVAAGLTVAALAQEQAILKGNVPGRWLIWMLIVAGLLPVLQALVTPGSAIAFLSYLLLTGAAFLLRYLQARAQIIERASRAS